MLMCSVRFPHARGFDMALATAVYLALGGCGTAAPGGGNIVEYGDVSSSFGQDDVATDATGGGEGKDGGAGNDASSSADTGGTADTTADVDVDPCPGGAGCACAVGTDCADGVCIDTPAGRRCAALCANGCAADEVCVASGGAVSLQVCAPTWLHLCAPCSDDAACAHIGDNDARCVDRGGKGGFCGHACAADGDCPSGYACEDAPLIEGGSAKQCVLADDAAECTCDALAIAASSGTVCAIGGTTTSGGVTSCAGQRHCGPDGLSACDATPPSEEVCDGVDNDCDGTTDGLPCDDGDACTEGDVCQSGNCTAGDVKTCDDGNPCTLDECALGTGACQSTPTPGAACDDGDVCSVGDVCTPDGCKGGALPCEDGNACTTDSCAAPDGCVHVAADGACSDGDACTSGDACQGGLCASVPADCDDKNGCTTDTCDAQAGCQHQALADGSACEGEGTCTAGVCKPKCPPSSKQTFEVSGKIESFVVPACVTTLTVELRGAQGGNSKPGGLGGLGAMVVGKVPVQAGETLQIVVGEQGEAAQYPCGGGGGSFLVRGSEPLLVAGGGGGAYSTWTQTGHSTALTPVGTQGTGGAESKLGGGGGGFHQDGQPTGGAGGRAFVNGAAGGNTYPIGSPNCGKGGFGGGGGGSQNGTFNAGGGGGYVGGKSGNGNATTGGSSFIGATVVDGKHTPQTQAGNGSVTVSW
ncbi:MAG: hypothetical protein RIT45_3930 [Pseudomonadota bacterium]